MCKYCMRLQELRKQEHRTIERWKKYCEKEERLLERCYSGLYVLNPGERDLLLSNSISELCREIREFLDEDMI